MRSVSLSFAALALLLISAQGVLAEGAENYSGGGYNYINLLPSGYTGTAVIPQKTTTTTVTTSSTSEFKADPKSKLSKRYQRYLWEKKHGDACSNLSQSQMAVNPNCQKNETITKYDQAAQMVRNDKSMSAAQKQTALQQLAIARQNVVNMNGDNRDGGTPSASGYNGTARDHSDTSYGGSTSPSNRGGYEAGDINKGAFGGGAPTPTIEAQTSKIEHIDADKQKNKPDNLFDDAVNKEKPSNVPTGRHNIDHVSQPYSKPNSRFGPTPDLAKGHGNPTQPDYNGMGSPGYGKDTDNTTSTPGMADLADDLADKYGTNPNSTPYGNPNNDPVDYSNPNSGGGGGGGWGGQEQGGNYDGNSADASKGNSGCTGGC